MSPAESGQSAFWHGTTILTVRKGGLVAVGGDGQVSIGQTIVKANARKVRRLGRFRGMTYAGKPFVQGDLGVG